MPYKVGDKVLCVFKDHPHKGKIGVVYSVQENGDGYTVKEENGDWIGGQEGWAVEESFVLLPPHTRPMTRKDVKEGIKVVCVAVRVQKVAGVCGTVRGVSGVNKSFYVRMANGQDLGSGYWVDTSNFHVIEDIETVVVVSTVQAVAEDKFLQAQVKKPCPSAYYGLDEPCTCGRCPPKRINAAFIKI